MPSSSHQQQHQKCISITIESLRGVDLTRLDQQQHGSVIGQTATVSFRGSIANMQIGTFPRLCPVSGYPAVESRPVVSTTVDKLSWPTECSHLTLCTGMETVVVTDDTQQQRCSSPSSGSTIGSSSSDDGPRSLERATSILTNWSNQRIPEILELRVRLGPSSVTGVCHLIVGKLYATTNGGATSAAMVRDLPLRSTTDDALSHASLRVWVNFDNGNEPPGIAECSSTQSLSSSSSSCLETTTPRLDLRTLVAPSTIVDGHQPRNGRMTAPNAAAVAAAKHPAAAAAVPPPNVNTTSHGCSTTGFFLREFRRAVWACQPIGFVTDDSSTIATQDSWDM